MFGVLVMWRQVPPVTWLEHEKCFVNSKGRLKDHCGAWQWCQACSEGIGDGAVPTWVRRIIWCSGGVFVPSLKNMFSILVMQDKGYAFMFKKGHMFICLERASAKSKHNYEEWSQGRQVIQVCATRLFMHWCIIVKAYVSICTWGMGIHIIRNSPYWGKWSLDLYSSN